MIWVTFLLEGNKQNHLHIHFVGLVTFLTNFSVHTLPLNGSHSLNYLSAGGKTFAAWRYRVILPTLSTHMSMGSENQTANKTGLYVCLQPPQPQSTLQKKEGCTDLLWVSSDVMVLVNGVSGVSRLQDFPLQFLFWVFSKKQIQI